MIEIKDNTELLDIHDLKVDMTAPKEDRIASYIKEVKEPYNILVNGTSVRIKYRSDQTIEDKLVKLIRREMQADNII